MSNITGIVRTTMIFSIIATVSNTSCTDTFPVNKAVSTVCKTSLNPLSAKVSVGRTFNLVLHPKSALRDLAKRMLFLEIVADDGKNVMIQQILSHGILLRNMKQDTHIHLNLLHFHLNSLHFIGFSESTISKCKVIYYDKLFTNANFRCYWLTNSSTSL